MPAGPRPRREPTDDWDQLRLLVDLARAGNLRTAAPDRALRAAERPPAPARPGVPERTLRRKVARFAADRHAQPLRPRQPRRQPDRRRLPLGIRQAIVELKAEYPPFGLREIAAHLPAPLRPPGQPPHGPAGAGHRAAAAPPAAALPALPRHRRSGAAPQGDRRPVPGGLERQGDRRLPGDARAHGLRDAARWDDGGLAGLGRPPAGPRHPARKVDLKAMAAIRRLQANPELGEFRIHAALAQLGIHLSPAHLRPHPGPAPGAGRAAAGRGRAPRAAADAVRGPAAAPVLVGRRPLRRGPPARHRQAGLRHLDPGELQPGAPRQRDLAAPGPDRLPDRAAGGDRGARGAGGARQRRRRHLPGQPGQGDLRRPGHRARSRSTRARPGRTTSRPTSTSCAAWPTTTTPGRTTLGGAAGRPRPLLPRLQPPAARRPRRPAQGTPQPGGGARLGAGRLVRPGRPRPALPAAGHARAQRAAAPCASATGGSTGNAGWPASGPRSGWPGRDADHRVRDRHPGPVPGGATRPTGAGCGRSPSRASSRTGHASPQPFLPLEEVEWHPAQRLAPYRPRRRRRGEGRQEPLFADDGDQAVGSPGVGWCTVDGRGDRPPMLPTPFQDFMARSAFCLSIAVKIGIRRRSGQDHDHPVAFDFHRVRLCLQLLDLDRVALHPGAVGVEDRAAGRQIELPAVPGAAQDLALAGVRRSPPAVGTLPARPSGPQAERVRPGAGSCCAARRSVRRR